MSDSSRPDKPKKIRNYRDLIVWRRAKTLAGKCYRLAAELPEFEKYDMGRQLRKAALSVPNNISEGHGRFSHPDYARHVSIARASAMEVSSTLEVAVEVGYLSDQQIADPLSDVDEIGRMLWSLAVSLKTKQLPAKTVRFRSKRSDA
jgi:four helix bundle protein